MIMPVLQETEREVQRAIMDWVNFVLPNFRVWRQNTGGQTLEYRGRKRFVRFGVAGQSDLTGIGPGGIRVEIEVKGPHGKLTDKQIDWLTTIQQAGGIAFSANSLSICIQRMREVFEARQWEWNQNWEL